MNILAVKKLVFLYLLFHICFGIFAQNSGEVYNPHGIELIYVPGVDSSIIAGKGFYIGKYEITQAQWWAIMGKNPSKFKGDNLPVEMVSQKGVQEFIGRLNVRTGSNYRLPTIAEWMYAACGGIECNYEYSGSNNIDDVAWYRYNSGNRTHPVGTKQPNEMGIYDMTGNVSELFQESNSKIMGIRGGSFASTTAYSKLMNVPFRVNKCSMVGFRVVLPIEEQEQQDIIVSADKKSEIFIESGIQVHAHDVITLRNGNEIKAKVTEITPSEIKYKRFDNLDGPTVVILKADVFAINYANGTREVINALNSTSATQTARNFSSDDYYSSRATGALGIKAGVNFANLSYIYFDWLKSWEGNVNMKAGFQVGLIGELVFRNQKLALQGGILYTQLGTNLEYSQRLNVKETAKITFHTIHFPVHIQYRHHINYNTTLLLQGGVYTDFCKSVNVEYEITSNGNKVNGDSASFFNSDNDMTDSGIGFGAAFLFNDRFQIGAGYDTGLKTRNLMVTMTFMFGR